MRLIDADALTPKLKFIREAEHQIYGKESWGFASKCITAIEDAPTIEERKTGTWEIYVISPFDGEGCQCSECKYEGAPYWNFCPNCGSYNGGM